MTHSPPPVQIWPPEFAEIYRRKGYWTGETMGGMLRDRAAAHPDRLAIVDGDMRWSYAELLERSERAAFGFRAEGLAPGDRVIVQIPNVAMFFPAVFGLFLAGLIPVYALPAHRETELAHFARGSGASGIVVARNAFDHAKLAEKVLAEVPSLTRIMIADELDGPRVPLPEADSSSVAFLQISGGSTGLSKLIPRTHDDYIYSFRASAEICALGPDSVYLAALPVAHNFPMSSPGVFGTLHAGGRIVMASDPTPDTVFPLIAREGVTITGLVPPLALLWMRAAADTPHDLSSLAVLGVGGAKFLPEAAARVGQALGCKLQQVFGMAEGLVNYTRLDDPDDIVINTQGRPISPDDEVKVVDENDCPVPEGESGHLLVRGPYTIRAYHGNPAANARSFTADGFYRTGDIVKRLSGGYLVVQGRAGDHINRAGEKISAEEVEDHLIAHPSIFDAAVVSVPDPALGEKTCAFVIRSGDVSARQIRVFMHGRGVADFKVPDQIVFVPEFENTAALKTSRKALRATLRARALEQS